MGLGFEGLGFEVTFPEGHIYDDCGPKRISLSWFWGYNNNNKNSGAYCSRLVSTAVYVTYGILLLRSHESSCGVLHGSVKGSSAVL